MSLRDEIREQPAAVARILDRGREPVERVADAVRAAEIVQVVIAARGTSDHAAIYAQYLLGTRHRLPVALATPSIVTLYGVLPRFERSLVVGISQSGASPDVVAVIDAAREQGAPTLAITNDPTSPLAAAAAHVVDLAAGPEQAVAATKTYTTELATVAMLAVALGSPDLGSDEAAVADEAALAALPDQVAAALDAEPEAEAIAADQAEADRIVVLGRGFEYATAREWALKLKELARVFADPYSAADFQHGPLALIEPGVPVLAVAPSGAVEPGMTDLLRRLRDDHEAELAILSDLPRVRDIGRWAMTLPAGVPEWLRPIVSIVPGQLHACHLTRARGLDPERPRAIAKVTLTR
jgi:glucosamine--fructose-6-phosphate aminotransferase (isomerizing)